MEKKKVTFLPDYVARFYATPTQRAAINKFAENTEKKYLFSPRISFEFFEPIAMILKKLSKFYDDIKSIGERDKLTWYIDDAKKAHKKLDSVLKKGLKIYRMRATSSDGRFYFYFAI